MPIDPRLMMPSGMPGNVPAGELGGPTGGYTPPPGVVGQLAPAMSGQGPAEPVRAPAKAKRVDEKVFCEFVVKEFDRYEKFHDERFAKCRKYYDLWAGKLPQKPEEWMNNIHVPMMIEAEQTITPRVYTALFPTDAPVDCQVEGDTPAQAGVVVKNLIKHYFRVTNVQGKFWSMLTQNTLFGTGYVEAGSWLVRRGWVIGEDGERYYTLIESRPDCKQVDFFELYPHPAKLTMDDGLPLIRRRYCDAEYLKSLSENPFFTFNNLQDALDSKAPKASDLSYQKTDKDEYEILDYWGPYDEQFEKDGKIVVKKAIPYWGIIINRKVCMRAIPNPYNHQMPPFVKIKLFEDAVPSWFGLGIGQIGHPSQERCNKIVNQRLDNVDLIMNQEKLVNASDTVINRKNLPKSSPGKVTFVSDIVSSMKWLEVPNVTTEAYKEEELCKTDFRESTGATSSMMPSDSVDDQHKTAMGIQLMQGAAGMRFRPVLKNIESDGIQAIAQFYFSNARQFMTIPEWVQIVGEEGQKYNVRISPEQIQSKVFFIPTGLSETVNKETQIANLMRFRELGVNDPTINRSDLNRRIGEFMGFKDLDKLIIKNQPIVTGPQQLSGDEQLTIQQRIAEGADPEAIKAELMGSPKLSDQPAKGPKPMKPPARPSQQSQRPAPQQAPRMPPNQGAF